MIDESRGTAQLGVALLLEGKVANGLKLIPPGLI
jgi:hypothetical protein